MKKLLKRWKVVAIYANKKEAKCLAKNLAIDMYWNKYKAIQFSKIRKDGIFAVIEKPRKNFVVWVS